MLSHLKDLDLRPWSFLISAKKTLPAPITWKDVDRIGFKDSWNQEQVQDSHSAFLLLAIH